MWQGKGGMEGTHSMMTMIIIIVMCCCLLFAFVCGVGDGSWLRFCQLKGWGVADLFAALAPPSLTSHVIHHCHSCCCRRHVLLVFKSPVQSSFWTLIRCNHNRNQFRLHPQIPKTGLNHIQPVQIGLVVVTQLI